MPVLFNHFGVIAIGMKPALMKIESERILDLQGKIQAFAPVLSGFMRDSVYHVLPDGSTDYGNATPLTDDVYLLPQEQPSGDMSGLVGVAANYSEWVNGGTRHMPPNPFFTMGCEAAGQEFEAKFAGLEDLLRGLI
jgi:hypothetical protein